MQATKIVVSLSAIIAGFAKVAIIAESEHSFLYHPKKGLPPSSIIGTFSKPAIIAESETAMLGAYK